MDDREQTIAALKDLMIVEERLAGNSHHLQQIRHAILFRWKVMSVLIVFFWCLSRYTRFIILSMLFYFFLFTFIVLIGVTLNSGRLFSAEQYKQDCCRGLGPFNITLNNDQICFTESVPSDIHQLFAAYRKEWKKRNFSK